MLLCEWTRIKGRHNVQIYASLEIIFGDAQPDRVVWRCNNGDITMIKLDVRCYTAYLCIRILCVCVLFLYSCQNELSLGFLVNWGPPALVRKFVRLFVWVSVVRVGDLCMKVEDIVFANWRTLMSLPHNSYTKTINLTHKHQRLAAVVRFFLFFFAF